MSLREKLEKEQRDLKEAETNAEQNVPVALSAVQVVLRDVVGFLENLGPDVAVIKHGQKKLQHPSNAWKATPFPTMEIRLRERTISIVPIGPVTRNAFRIDINCAGSPAAYSLLWSGSGSSINDWSIVPHSPQGQLDIRNVKHVSPEWLDEAFEKLVGF
jgi:hypothetical protein